MLFTDVQRSVRLNKKKKSTNISPYPDKANKEKQSVPDGERPVVHIAIVCGFLQGASGWTRPVFFLENFKTSSDFGEWLP